MAERGVDKNTPLCHYPCMGRSRAKLEVSDAEFARVVADNISIAAVIRGLNRAIAGTSYRLVLREVARLGLNTDHWKGKSHGTSKGRPRTLIPWDKVLIPDSPHRLSSTRKARLIHEGFIKEVCTECGRGPEWLGKPLTLVLDHINGVRDDHRRENLRLVCPNCDSQLPTFCGRNKRGKTYTRR
jgi:hypothetical protein